jgi:hypothetical protein
VVIGHGYSPALCAVTCLYRLLLENSFLAC